MATAHRACISWAGPGAPSRPTASASSAAAPSLATWPPSACQLKTTTLSSRWVRAGARGDVACASTRDSQHGPPCKSGVSCFLENLDTSDEGDGDAPDAPDAGGQGGGGGGGERPQRPRREGAGQLPRREWLDMTTEDFRKMREDGTETIAILPVSAVEQHGPHLPVSVDVDLNEGVLRRALELADPAVPITILPMQKVGKSNEHMAFPGTLTLSADTLTALWLDIGDSVARAGVKKLILFNSHGGQPQVMEIVARELRVRHGMLVVCLSWFGLGLPDGLISRHEQLHGIHGGEIETSMMLHLRPEVVKMDKAEDFVPLSVDLHRDYKLLLPEGGVGFGWMSQDLHPCGATGNAAAATEEKGRLLVDHAAEKLVELFEEVERFPLSFLRPAEEAGGDAWRECTWPPSEGAKAGAGAGVEQEV